MDVRKYLSQKLEALNCHQSQMNPNSLMGRSSQSCQSDGNWPSKIKLQ
jgi:LmbE family N-acetylglucosaminyl deacetylase